MVRAFHIEETEIRSKMSEEKRLAAPSLHEISEESRISNAMYASLVLHGQSI